MDYAPELQEATAMKSASALNLVLGAWLFASPAMLGTTGVEAVNAAVCGVLIMVVATGSLLTPRASCVTARTNFFIGLWSFVSPWFLAGLPGDGFALLNGMFIGAFVVVLALARAVPAPPALCQTLDGAVPLKQSMK